MAWFGTYTDAPVIDLEPENTVTVHLAEEALAGIWQSVDMEITTARSEIQGLTKAAAAAAVTALADPDNGVNARAFWAGNGSYTVNVDVYNTVVTRTPIEE